MVGTNSSVYVFGSGDCGQLGLGEDKYSAGKPTLLKYFEGRRIVSIAAGGLHTLALDADGKVYSWGCNDEKALGHTGPEFSVSPVTEGLEGVKITQIAAGDSISAALAEDGRVFSWGTFRDSKGILGYDASGVAMQEKATLIESLSKLHIVHISAGANHLIALSVDKQVYSWGCGEQGQLGRRILERHKQLALRPTNVTPRRGKSFIPFGKAVCGSYHTLLLAEPDSAAGVFAMGLNNFGQLGLGDFEERPTACPVDAAAWNGEQVVDLSAGEHHSLALTASGSVFAFGRADSGQLGIASMADLANARASPNPVKVPALAGVTQISTGGNHNLALVSATNSLFSWGYGEMHQLGHSAEQDERTPRQVSFAFPGKISAISAGGQHSVVLLEKS